MNLQEKKDYEMRVNFLLVRKPIEAALENKNDSLPLYKRVIRERIKLIYQLVDEFAEFTDEEKLIINSQLHGLNFPSLETMIDEFAELEAA